jgi:hypothetical protein
MSFAQRYYAAGRARKKEFSKKWLKEKYISLGLALVILV